MFYITVTTKNATSLLQPLAKTLKAAKSRYHRQMAISPFGLTLNDIDEIVVWRGNKIYGYYDHNFKRKTDVPVCIHNIIYGVI